MLSKLLNKLFFILCFEINSAIMLKPGRVGKPGNSAAFHTDSGNHFSEHSERWKTEDDDMHINMPKG